MFTAAVLTELRKPLKICRLEIPRDLQVGQVGVRLKYSGICGAQLGEQEGVKGPDKYLWHCMGHEGAGVVESIGPGVRGVNIRDNVVLHWRKGTGIDALPPQYWCEEESREVGAGQVSTLQEFTVVSENRLTKIDKDVPLDIAALMGCAVSTGLGVVVNDVQVKIGQSVVVLGCGGVGLNVLQGCALASAYPIIGVDVVEAKLNTARVLGATHTIHNIDNIQWRLEDAIRNILGKSGADVVIDTTGNPKVMETAWNIAGNSGKVCFVAQLRHDQTLPLQTLPMHHGRTIIGSDGGGTNPTVDIPRYLRLYKAGKLNLSGLITHRTNLRNINNMLDLIRSGVVGRAIIEM